MARASPAGRCSTLQQDVVAGHRAYRHDRARRAPARRSPAAPSEHRCLRPTRPGPANLSAASGKVALVRDGGARACGASAGSCLALSAGRGPGRVRNGRRLRGLGGTRIEQHDGRRSARRRVRRQRRQLGRLLAAALLRATRALQRTRVRTASAAALGLGVGRRSGRRRRARSLARARAGDSSASARRPPGARQARSRSASPCSATTRPVMRSACGGRRSHRPSAGDPGDRPAGGVLGSGLAGGALVPVPSHLELTLGTTSAISAAGGDVWPTSVGFSRRSRQCAPAATRRR